MTPAARVAAAIDILDRIVAGEAAERALTNWARGARFAGSKDRAAIRDHVFDALRRWRSTATLGSSGRARMITLLRQQGIAPETLFTGEGHAAPPLTEAEHTAPITAPEALWDLPDWAIRHLRADHPDEAEAIAETLRHRAEVFLRVNVARATREAAQAALQADGIDTEAAPLSVTALRVLSNPRRVVQSRAYTEGLVELQDAASQAIIDALPLKHGLTVLDYCAGGGGKALAIAARTQSPVDAHDADPRRMSDLPDRARRAGAEIRRLDRVTGRYDLVLCDVPCSGSGAWRRAPEGKWRMTEPDLAALLDVQAEILATCQAYVAPQGSLAYVTCSVFHTENRAQIEGFMARHPEWRVLDQRAFLPSPEGDGLFLCILRRDGG